MPSSIFSSRKKRFWKTFWIAALSSFLCLMAGSERLLRMTGHTAMVRNDWPLWSWWRDKGAQADGRTLMVLGSSRIEAGFVPEAWKEIFPAHRIIQLANTASSSIPVLEDLAGDPGFHGLVLCEVSVFSMGSLALSTAEDMVRYYHEQFGFWDRWTVPINAFLQNHFVISSAAYVGESVLKELLKGRYEASTRYAIFPDRRVVFEFQKPLSKKQIKARVSIPEIQEMIPPKLRDEGLRRLNLAAQTIERHGGRVVFTEYVSTREKGLRSYFWEPLESQAKSPGIYFEDDPFLSTFRTPDGSHLDGRDAGAYTRRLAEIIREKGWFEDRPSSEAVSRLEGEHGTGF